MLTVMRLISSLDGSLLDVGPPQILINSTEMVLLPNATLELTCTGTYTLEWLYPGSVAPRVILTSVACPTCPQSVRYRSMLQIDRMESQDTSLYQCVYSRQLDSITNETSTGIYIFVKSKYSILLWIKSFQALHGGVLLMITVCGNTCGLDLNYCEVRL